MLDDASGDPSAVTRDYLLDADASAAPLLSVCGGKITTFRKLAEDAADDLGRMLGETRPVRTAAAFLAGGDLENRNRGEGRGRPGTAFDVFLGRVRTRAPWLPGDLAEWSVTGDDVLWRRSKLGLHATPAERDAVAAWMRQHARPEAEAACA